VIRQAIYGRRRVGKCLEPEEANLLQDPRYFGCSENVLHIVDTKCSGRKDCEISIPDPDLDGTSPCLPGLKKFLEVSYTCVEGEVSQPLSAILRNTQTDNMNTVAYCFLCRLIFIQAIGPIGYTYVRTNGHFYEVY